MGRRASIVGSISKIVHDVGVHERRKERERTVQSAISNAGPKEKAPVYSLLSVHFDEETRSTKIEFKQTTEYRTIERYVQRNYVKYPVYSNWKTKTKIISKSIKLTDEALESLNCNPDFLIREFATGIIDRIDDEDFYPSWYLINYLKLDEKQKNQSLTSQLSTAEANNKKSIMIFESYYSGFVSDLKTIQTTKAKYIKKKNKYSKIVSKIKTSKKSLIWKIFSFGIYAYMVSDKRLIKYKYKLSFTEKIIEEMNTFEIEYPKLKDVATSQQKVLGELAKIETAKYNALIKKEKEKTAMLINEVLPLTASVDED